MTSRTKNIFYILAIGAVNFGICSIPWIPNEFLKILLWVIFIGLSLWSVYLIYSIYSLNSLISLLLIVLFGFVNFINFIVIVFSGIYVKEYVFDNKKFYVYDTSFRDRMSEISVKMDYLPIRKEVVELGEPSDDMILYRDKNIIYFMFDNERHDMYDLNTSSIVIVWC